MGNEIRKQVVILGAGGFAREVLWVFKDINKDKPEWEILGFIDENPDNHGKILCDVPVLGGFEWFDSHRSNAVYAICGVGTPRTKKRLVEKCSDKGIPFCSVIHPSVLLSEYVTIGKGTVITAGNILTTQIEVGDHVIINLDCTIGHDTVIENYCTILPGCHVSGNVHIGKGADLGTGSVIIQGKQIGAWSIIGAGAVVTSDIPAHVTAVGIPAKVIKQHTKSEADK